MSTCPHGKPIGATCYVCAAEAVQAGVKALRAPYVPLDMHTATGYHLDELMKVPLRPYGMTDEQVREGRMMLGILPEPLTPEQTADLDIYAQYVGRMQRPYKRGGARALAIVALRRIVDRAVSDEVSSLATTDILRIALKALNQLED